MAKIVMTRENEWMNKLKHYSVLINGKDVGSIKSGGTKEYNLGAGQYDVECKINFYYSNRFVVNLQEEQTVYLLVKSNTKKVMIGIFLLIFLLLITSILQIKGYIAETVMHGIRIGYFIVIFAYFLYMVTLGRKKYLLLGPDTSNPFAN